MPEPNVRLAATMVQLDMSASRLAAWTREAAARNGRTLHCTHVDVRRWLDGVTPRPATAVVIADALSRRAGRRLSVEDIGLGGGAAGAVLASSLAYGASGLEAGLAVADLARSELADSPAALESGVSPAAWPEVMLSWLLARPTPHHDQAAQRPAVGLADVAAIRATSDMFTRLDFAFGGGHARTALAQYYAHDVKPLLRGSYSESVGKALFSVASEIVQLLGWTAYDVGLHGLAQRYQIQALRLAQEAGDVLMGGRLLADMSHQANYLGHSAQAAQLARAAQEGAGRTASATTRAMFLAMEARAHAGNGDEAACIRAFAAAEREFGLSTPEDDPEWMAYFTAAELAGEGAHCFRDLRKPATTQEFVVQALEPGPEYARTLAFIRLVKAASHIHQGEPVMAAQIGQDAMELASGVKSIRYRRYVRDLWADLQPYAADETVRAFGQLAEALDSQP